MIFLMSSIFIGPLNLSSNADDGATFKNRILLKELKSHFFIEKVFDTYNWRRNLVIIKLFFYLIFDRNRRVYISLNTYSAYRILVFLNMIRYKGEIHYFVIGDTIGSGVLSGRYNFRRYFICNNIFVEGLRTKDQLETKLSNIRHLPNFKEVIAIRKEAEIFHSQINNRSDEFKFLFLSRVVEEKGIDILFDAVDILRNEIGQKSFSLTIIGPIEDNYREHILRRQGKLDCVVHLDPIDLLNYKNYGQIVGYDCMVFPTFWLGEGFPGVLIDAFIVGMPVIASDWNLNTEIVIDRFNGLIFKNKDAFDLADKMNFCISNFDFFENLRRNSFDSAVQYDAKNIFKVIS